MDAGLAAIPVEEYKNAMRHVATSVAVVTYRDDDGWKGQTTTAICSATTEPPTLVVCIRNDKPAAARIRDSEEEVFGELRVTTTIAFGTLWLAPRLPTLYSRYPDLKIDLMLEERVLDLPMREADVAIRMKEPSQADLIRKRLMSVRMRLYATPEYLRANGTPETLADMANFRLLCQAATAAQVSAGASMVRDLLTQPIRSTFTVNNYFGVLQAVLANLGIGLLPDYLTEDFPNLVRVLPDIESAEVPVFLAYPEELRHSKRIAAFRDFVMEEIIAYRRNRGATGT